ncbi:MAG: hypothetical protein AAGG07_06410 [Planctomycetota bacterium]
MILFAGGLLAPPAQAAPPVPRDAPPVADPEPITPDGLSDRSPPERVTRLTRAAADASASQETRLRAIRDLARLDSIQAANALLRIARTRIDEPWIQAAAYDALRALARRPDLEDDIDAWDAWLTDAKRLSIDEWERELRARTEAMLAESREAHAETIARLRSLYRRLNLDAAGPTRSALQAELLRDSYPELRELGFELVNRDLAESREPGPVVSEASIDLLAHDDPSVRASSARVLLRLQGDASRAPLLTALTAERDAAAASAQLGVARRWPDVACVGPAITWLESATEAAPAAADALLALHRSGVLGKTDRVRTVEALREIATAAYTPSMLRLLVETGDRSDLERVAGRLNAEQPSDRIAAATALQGRAETVDLLLAAAAQDPALYTYAASSVAATRPNRYGYERLAELEPPSADARSAALADVLARMPTPEVLAVAQGSDDLDERHTVLTALAVRREEAARFPDAWAEAMLMLAETDLDRGLPAGALAAVEAAGEPADTDRARDLRATALLVLGQIDAAAMLDAPASVWLRAAELARDLPHLSEIAEQALAAFGEQYDQPERARLQRFIDASRQPNSVPSASAEDEAPE